MAEIQKILIFRLSSIGDIILTTPLLRSLRKAFPGSEIWYVTKKQYASLLASSPHIDHLIAFDSSEGFPGLRKLKHQLRKEHFDVFLDIHKSWRSRFVRIGSGARMIGTYPKNIFRRFLLIRFRINLYRHIQPVYLRYFEAVKKLNVPYDGHGSEIIYPPAAEARVEEWLQIAGYDPALPLVVICPGATYFNKKWPSDRFVETARALMQAGEAYVIVHGGKDDAELCGIIAAASGAGDLAGKLNLSESAALLKKARVVIANDSGLLHLAQSQKTPVVGIYGPTTRELGFYPIEKDSTVIETSLYCRPCTPKGLNYCPQKHFRCMKDISSERVIKAAQSYL